MKSRIINIFIFILSIMCLILSCKLFYNRAIHADEFGISPAIINGGEIWALVDWITLLIMVFIIFLSGINVFRKK